MASLSIIIVTYNNAVTIRPCLRSLNLYIPPDISSQIILVDNASSDETVKFIEEECSLFKSSITYQIIVNKINRWFALAVNQGLQKVSSEYIMLLNPDTEITLGMCETLMDFIQKNPEVGIVAPQHRSPDGTIRSSCRRFPTYWSVVCELVGLSKLFAHHSLFNAWKMGEFNHRTSREVEQPMGACLLTTRNAIEKIGEMDEQFVMFFNDVDWCRRFKDKNYTIMYLADSVLVHHGGHSVYQRRSHMILLSHLGLFRYFQKYYNRWWEKIINYIFFIILMLAAVFRILLWNISPKK